MSGNYKTVKDIYREYFDWRSKFLRQNNTLAYINLFFIDWAVEDHGPSWEVVHKLYRNKK